MNMDQGWFLSTPPLVLNQNVTTMRWILTNVLLIGMSSPNGPSKLSSRHRMTRHGIDYKLKAVIVHLGAAGAGHYIAFREK